VERGLTRPGKGHVLVVDDQPQLLEIFREQLDEAGFFVETARDGSEALTAIERLEPEVVVADVEMPGMDGYELCRRLRASGRDQIPFLFCSGHGAPDARREGLRAGADDYITKPVDPDELVLKLTRQVERVRTLRAAAQAAAPRLNAAEMAALERQLLEGGSEAGVRLGRFELHRVLGRGSMGTVFQGWDTKLQRWVAVKTVRAGAAMEGFWDENLVRRLVSEAAMVARFNHPHVVQVHDVQEASDAAYLVLELVDGVSLQALLSCAGRLAVEGTVPMMGALASALAAAHSADLVHRDVKPSNVLLGRDGAIKLTDFGIASFLSSGMQGALFGTPGYVPPETLRGQGIEASGDLFALGAVGYQCLTGRPAFWGGTPEEILTNTVNQRVPPLREAGVDVPAELEAIVSALLEPDPKRRIAQAALLAGELSRMSTFWGWRWTAPDVDWVRTESEAAAADANARHGQVLATIESGTLPGV
jgi:DNA-binding response OmpR family regulator